MSAQPTPTPHRLRLVDGSSSAGSSALAAPPSVLHVRVVAGAGGGPDKTILRSPRYVDPARYRVAAAYIHPHDDPGMDVIRQHARDQACPLFEISESGPLDPRTVRDLYHLCRKLRVAIWHGHDYKSNALGLLLRRLWPMQLVTTVHGWTHESLRTRLYYRIDNLCLPRYEQVMTVSPQLHEHCLNLGVPENRLTYIPNGIELDRFQRTLSAAEARLQLGVPADRLILGVVGRLSIEKGVDRALRTFASLHRIYPQLELHLIGDGPQRPALERLAQNLGVRPGVRFHGWQADPRLIYQAMDALLIPSRTEGLPNALLEAMALGVPAASTDVGAVRLVLDHGRCGVILEGSSASWPGQLSALLHDASLRRDLAARARRRVEKHYSFERRMQSELSVYDRTLSLGATPLRQAA